MINEEKKQILFKIPDLLKIVGILGGTLGLLVVILSTIAYIPEHPEFSILTTYLSDIGDTDGWPQIIFNSGTLIAAPIRYLIIVLLALRLFELGAGRAFVFTILLIGFISTFGTILMTATPFSVAPGIHKMGIGLYFLGVVCLQLIIFIREWTLKSIPRLLPILSISMVIIFLVFAILMILYGKGIVNRNIPVIWEWMCFLSSIIWVFAHSIILGDNKGKYLK
ncbi:hypothetical protein ES703_24672 [subsurface metagenome]